MLWSHTSSEYLGSISCRVGGDGEGSVSITDGFILCQGVPEGMDLSAVRGLLAKEPVLALKLVHLLDQGFVLLEQCVRVHAEGLGVDAGVGRLVHHALSPKRLRSAHIILF